MREKSILKNMIWNSMKSIVSLAFPLLTFMYTSRVLKPEGLGKINFSSSFVAYFTMIAMLGVTNYSTREAAKYRENRDKLSQFVSEILHINIVSMMVSYMLLFLSVVFFAKIQSYIYLILIYSVSIFLNVIGIEWLYAAVEDYKYISIRTLIVQLFAFVGVILFVKSAIDAWKYAIFNVISSCGSFIVNFIHARKYVVFKKVSYRESIHKHLGTILIIFGSTLFIQVFIHLDSTMLGFITGDRAVGLYSAANKMSVTVSSTISALVAVIFPRISNLLSTDNKSKVIDMIYKAINILLILSIPMTVGLILISPQIVNLFSGKEYLEAILAARIMALRIFLVPFNSFCVLNLFVAFGMEKKNLFSTGFAAIINFIANLILIPYFAHNGASIATVLSETVEFIINIIYIRKIINIRYAFQYLYQYVVGAIVIIITYLIVHCLKLEHYNEMIFFIPLSIIEYYVCLSFYNNRYLEMIKEKFIKF